MSGRAKRALRLPAAAALAAVLWAAPAQADVLELGPGGAVIVHARPAIVTPDGARPISPDPAAGPPPATAALERAGARVDVSPLLLEAVAWAESRFNHRARSPAGAIGMMQLMPATAAEMGVDPYDPEANLHGGARYLRRMLQLFDGDIERALAAYNAGPEAVRRHNGVPPYRETRAYVAAVLDYMAARTQETR